MLNGPAARLGEIGDVVVILAYGYYEDTAARRLKARIVHVDAKNVPTSQSTSLRPGKKRGV
jgi:aspartate 1-decarboxylase